MKKLALLALLVASNFAYAQHKKITFWVDGVCGMCEKRIESALINSPGVKFADWDKETRQVTVAYNSKKLSEQKLYEIVAGVGHDTQKVPAIDGDYAKLPGCCKYRTLSKH
jgi:periplasmic mercuric ion binding protein